MPAHTLTFAVPGDPLPKGSSRVFMIAGQPRITSATTGLKDWENRVAMAADFAARTGDKPPIKFYGAIELRLEFLLTRPESLPKRVTDHLRYPDLDKLTRAVGDALAGVLYDDDRQVTVIHARKDYAAPAQVPGVRITISGDTDAPVQRRRPAQPAVTGDRLDFGSPDGDRAG